MKVFIQLCLFAALAAGAAVPPTITQQPEGGFYVIGSEILLSVVAAGTSPLAYQWRKSGVAIQGADSASYTILDFQPENEGTYDVVVTNIAGMIKSDFTFLLIGLTPRFALTFPLGDPFLLEGQSQPFVVSVHGTGPISYQWRKDEVPVPGATTNTFSLEDVTQADEGVYNVEVSNVVGVAYSRPTRVHVYRAATQVPRISDIGFSHDEGFSATLTGQLDTKYRMEWTTNFYRMEMVQISVFR